MTLGELIHAKRTSLSMSLQEVSDAAGVSKGQLHAIEHDQAPNVALITCVRISVALGLPVQAMGAAALQSAIAHGIVTKESST
jgi:transcriptional regulator with XRE-family HTH domain